MLQRTIADRIAITGGVTSGFDYLRLFLAVSVLFGHSALLTGHMQQMLPWGLDAVRGYLILPMFFSLSGFLVATSLVRTKSLPIFLTLRGLRIAPALVVEITLSALVLGPILTQTTFTDYFTNIEFFRYFWNFVGWPHYLLPGVFLDNPVPRTVNGSLWTVPYEAECYLTLAALSLIGLVKRGSWLLVGLLSVAAVGCVWVLWHGDPNPAVATATGRQLILFFLGGVVLYLLRSHVPYSGWIAAACFLFVCAFITSHVFIFLTCLPVAYLTVYLGLQQPKKAPIIFTGDYSYGVYLYAFPIQQAVVQTMPYGRNFYVNFVVSLIAVSFFAAFSWHVVEKPVLRLKRFVIRLNDQQKVGARQPVRPMATSIASDRTSA